MVKALDIYDWKGEESSTEFVIRGMPSSSSNSRVKEPEIDMGYEQILVKGRGKP